MSDATLNAGLAQDTTVAKSRSFGSVFSKMWAAFEKYQQARADRAIVAALKQYDDAYLRSVGIGADDISSLHNRM